MENKDALKINGVIMDLSLIDHNKSPNLKFINNVLLKHYITITTRK